ncbi:sensor histidine kinase [Corallococcus exercitus]|uniref:histidine kinase n=1 Tax=Corallococcus exercitus TaxID=2316736 RepID=A0A7Y4NDI3_9BACT|nr:HAMP domain-containing sensor histidine kinase [Corallococcus exercitus]NOK09476.1 HAMP domain-containing histidine kinase [Corallococcus exercitus]
MSGAVSRPRRLFWYLYAYGLLMLVGAFVAFEGSLPVVFALSTDVMEFRMEALHLAELASAKSPALARELGPPAAAKGTRATLYGLHGELLASSVQPPLKPFTDEWLRDAKDRLQWGPPPVGPLTDEELRDLKVRQLWVFQDNTFVYHVAPVWNGDTLAGHVVTANPRRFSFYELVGGLMVFELFVLAGLSFPIARVLAAPLERLTAAVREFGQGRLSARARLKGRHEVAELGRTFDEMAGRMESLIRGQKELLANVSHELRTPLSRLGVTLDLVEEGQPDELARRLPELRRDIGELQQLVDGVLQMARLDLAANQAGQPGLGVQRSALDPADFLRDTAERFRQGHPECPLHLELAPGLPALEADAVLLRRAVHNLLDNARKYSEPGSPVTLRARADGGTVHVEVEDRGIGISADDLPSLSTPFFRTDRSRTRDTGGVGLGLTLVRRIVEAHGGTLAIHSVPEGGTRVTLTLPRAPAAPVAA